MAKFSNRVSEIEGRANCRIADAYVYFFHRYSSMPVLHTTGLFLPFSQLLFPGVNGAVYFGKDAQHFAFTGFVFYRPGIRAGADAQFSSCYA